MDHSRLPKKQKLTGTSYMDIEELLQEVVDLRETFGTWAITTTHSFDMDDLKRQMLDTEWKIKEIETCGLPDMDPIFKGFRTLSKEHDEIYKKIAEHIPLLKILIQKKKCPIAKIIDEI